MLVERSKGVLADLPEQVTKFHDMELVLSLSLVREHCKIDDVVSVGDSVLALYRQAALETAEKYTGLMLGKSEWITDFIEHPEFSRSHRFKFFEHRTKYPFAHPIGYYYGFHGTATQQIGLRIGTNIARLPIISSDFGIDCCHPCGTGLGQNFLYMAGYSCENDIPAAFKLGALRYIAYCVENAGDGGQQNVYISAKSGAGSGSNPAFSSGALEIWRTIRADAI